LQRALGGNSLGNGYVNGVIKVKVLCNGSGFHKQLRGQRFANMFLQYSTSRQKAAQVAAANKQTLQR
jgi:hypothetical protein